MELQDEWLVELTDLIAGAGRLERTVIAVTADHGLRTRVEYPELPVGRISDVMFRVPLMIYAPQTLRAPVVVQAPTSHVDVAPTLLALLGEPAAAARMQGVPLWQRTPADRLYMLASAYGGADGFLDGGRFYMRQAMSGAVYANDRFVFESGHQAPPHDPVVAFVGGALDQAHDAQLAVLARLRDQ
jgi:arylsulfatase A-like enzyme